MNQPAFTTVLDALFDEGQKPQVVAQLLAVVACLLLAWLATRLLRGHVRAGARRYAASAGGPGVERLRQVSALSDLMFPALAALLLGVARVAGAQLHQPVTLVHVVMVLAFSFVLVRLVVHVLRRVLSPGGPLVAFERSIAVIVWGGVALYVLGWLPDALQASESVVFNFGKTHISLLQILQAAVTVAVTLIVALWAGASLEARLMRAQDMDASLRVVLSRAGNAVLITVAVLVSLSLVGIDLTVLSIFGGALGVGLGLGFQRIASSYVSGFIILLDRSLRIGDIISVDRFHGTVTQIRTRYTVLRALDGTDAIIPNDLLVSQAVLNHSYTDSRVRLSLKVQVRLGTDVDRALELMAAAARAETRVLADPAPAAFLTGMTSGGLDLELGFWIADPQQGSLRIKSDINRTLWSSFQAQGVLLPEAPRLVVAPEGASPAAAESRITAV